MFILKHVPGNTLTECIDLYMHIFTLALKVILLDRLQGIICSVIQEPYLLGVML